MKRWISIICVAVMLLTMSGCAPLYAVLDELVGNEQVAAVEATPHIGFSTGEVSQTKAIVPLAEFDLYPITYTAYHSSLIYDALTPTEQTIFRAYAYALENGYTNILFDEKTIEGFDQMFTVLEYLALSSPLVEQNLRYDSGTFTVYHPVTVLDMYERDAVFSGLYITVYNFEQQWWEEKLRAIDKAEEIVAGISTRLSEARLAEKIYRYVGENVTYMNYEDEDIMEVHPYLTDALIGGATHCDGYTNALALLFRTAGIECVEKQYTTNSIDEVGHTWNCIKLDGMWYNVDGTYNGWIPEEGTSMGGGVGFGYSDILHDTASDYASLYPACENELYMTIDARVTMFASDEFIEEAVSAYEERDREWAYILVEEYNETDEDRQMQTIANRIQGTIYYVAFPALNGRHAILIHNGKWL